MKILVVGGGTSGLISALILKKFLNAKVDIVHSRDIGIIGVGEGSTEHFNNFLNFLEIDHLEIIKECGVTYKSGIMFEGWSDRPYLHSLGSPFADTFAQHPSIFSYLISNNYRYVNSKLLWKNKIHSELLGGLHPAFNQYHFNTYMLNEFLIKKCIENKINIYEDEINEVLIETNGNIDFILGGKQKYKYDFYIDCTGFRKILIGRLGAKWNSFGKYLKMKSAIVFPSEDEEEYNLWTLAKTMDYGWRFKIPTWGRHGNGYIYDSDYISKDKAKQELDEKLGYDVEISKEFKFDPGYLEKVWINNCVAIGISGSFIEPLEATSIGTSIQQSFLLMHRIMQYSQKDIDLYNKEFTSIMENARDFIALHYVTKKYDSDFWKNLKKESLPESLSYNLERWKNKMPIQEDFIETSNYSLFGPLNFILVMEGLNLFNRDSIKKEFNSLSEKVQKESENKVKEYFQKELSSRSVGHKKFLEILRNS